jgi:hypothetical protein
VVKRKPVGDPVLYKDAYLIAVTHMGPDLLCHVNGVELSGFYLTREAAVRAGERYADDDIKARGHGNSKTR